MNNSRYFALITVDAMARKISMVRMYHARKVQTRYASIVTVGMRFRISLYFTYPHKGCLRSSITPCLVYKAPRKCSLLRQTRITSTSIEALPDSKVYYQTKI